MGDRQIQISTGNLTLAATLNELETANQLWESLPITGRVQIWGDEIYFSIPLNVEEELGSQETVQAGTVAYWPPGSALCLFWGPTPISAPGEIRPASAVNVVGILDNDPNLLAEVPSQAEIIIEKIEG
ncbi:MAG: hypothetical protein EGP07_01670 [SAR202 cluster bacterium]|jgi:hypothetical protein|nr:MAG: hypothetical protein EGP11_04110 [SAR202 cluster bacterium]MBI01447.1 hypothetical protein [Chloroflexota bacterium]MCH2530660.1 cyclophilin-like fold protein [Dehalococcoidia bacterium]KAA1301519.1 MAG: hypothetical protein EGP07_01670 [SAR202 cluster bacterium]KAA1304395.1 MAG: hypothetical protein EGP04_02740 [SAR202 cluster bacterium]|tara:strand:- start:451 stop:834 length:384 start_codon:yes stop_codon:yes gene_type:complete